MGKTGKGKKNKNTGNQESQKKCICEDPYKCKCGNRPERPSRGHKWDAEKQVWAGKVSLML